jgi:hypothetical protein
MLPTYWPNETRFRTMLREGVPPMIMWITLDSVDLVELLGSYGIDAVIIDCEHTSTSLKGVSSPAASRPRASATPSTPASTPLGLGSENLGYRNEGMGHERRP